MIRNEIKNIRELSVENYEGTNIRQTINDNILDNIARYRADWNYFNETYLDIKDIVLFQKMILTTVADNDVIDVIASRGLSKSFITALCALDIALLYPKSEILVVSKTIGQANLIITEKIKNGFCAKGTKFASPVLVQMRKDNYIRIVADDYGCMQVIFGNGSTIKAIVCGEGGRGKNFIIKIIIKYKWFILPLYLVTNS
jgi:hypothetical protein